MKIALAGGTGFIGKELIALLKDRGHTIYLLTRNSDKFHDEDINIIEWLNPENHPERYLEDMDAFVNLSGTPLNSGRWTLERKQEIVESRLNTVKEVHRILKTVRQKPKVFINASAIGFYGTSENQIYTEKETTAGVDFLAETVTKWEEEASHVYELGIRTVYARFGLILGTNGGALPKLILPYKLFMGGKLGTGQQWYSWIHIDDVARALLFCIQNSSLTGPVNITAPEPVQMDDFGRAIGQVLHRPHWTVVPSNILRLVLGEMSLLILKGQQVIPVKLLKNDFKFIYPKIEPALRNLIDNE